MVDNDISIIHCIETMYVYLRLNTSTRYCILTDLQIIRITNDSVMLILKRKLLILRGPIKRNIVYIIIDTDQESDVELI